MDCAEAGCEECAKGLDIESAYDELNEPIYAVTYECPNGHRFIAEYERDGTPVTEKDENIVYA